MIFLKLIFLTGFCVLNTNAYIDRGVNNTCLEIIENPNSLFSDLQIVKCTIVEVSDIKLTDYGLKFTVKHPHNRLPDTIKLNRTEQKLFNKDTVITFVEKSKEDCDEWNNIETTTLGQYLSGFDDVTLFNNYERHASMILYRKGSKYYVEGNIEGKVLRYVDNKDYVADEPSYVLAEFGPHNCEPSNNKFDSLRVDQTFYDLSSNKLDRIQINLAPIIDGRLLNYGIVDSRTLLRPILSYYNYLDMVFGVFSSPSISFTIKKIVIPKTDVFLPYIDQSNSVSSTIFLSNVYEGLGKFMSTQKINFGLTSNDIVIFMAGQRILDDVSESGGFIPSTTFYKRSICEKSVNPLIIFSVYSDYINDYLLWHLISKFQTTSRIKEALKYSIQTPNLGCPGFLENLVEMNGRKRSYVPWINDCLANMMSHYFKHHDCSAYNKHYNYSFPKLCSAI